jgi:hypothetical protein
MTDWSAELDQALGLTNATERKLAVASLVDELVSDLGFRAIVVGGVAVEFWTHGEYSTTDIDLYLPHGPAADERLALLGFRREGRHWVLPEHELFIEAPASFPAQGEEVAEVELSNGRRALVLAPEDVLMYRLDEFVATGHPGVAEQSVALLDSREVDQARVVRRAQEEGLLNALTEIERLSERLRRGEEVGAHELHEIARRLRSGA